MSAQTPGRIGIAVATAALTIVGLFFHSVAVFAASQSGKPGPRRTLPAVEEPELPPPSLGPQPRFDDGGRLFDVPGIPYTFEVPTGWTLCPERIRDAVLWPARPVGDARVSFEGTFQVRDTSGMSDSELARYARTAIRIWSPMQPHIAFQRTADGSRAFRFPLGRSTNGKNSLSDRHYYTLIFHGSTALVVSTTAGPDPTPETIREVQRANDAAITSIRFR